MGRQHHPGRTHKGCGVCKPHKARRQGRPIKDPFSVVRLFGGKRYDRRSIPDSERE
jgi:hypothetical protein